jgi:N-acetylneuraminate synthase
MEININGRKIGTGYPAFIIAEACDNHFGDLDRAKEMALRSKLAGVDAVKYQHHLPDAEMLPDIPMSDNFEMPLYEFLRKYALTLDDHRELIRYCEQIGILYLCTPFSWEAAKELEQLGVSAYKIGSGEMTDLPTLDKIADFGKPMIISTGMSTWEEIDRTYNLLSSRNIPLVLNNCVSEYPPKYEDVNLGVIPKMIARYPKALIGHSDHTPDLFTCFAARTLGAVVFEKHVTISRLLPGPDRDVSIEFDELHELVDGIRKIEAASGADRKIHEREKQIREWAFRSLVARVDIKKGQKITAEMVWSKRPGTGIPSHRMNEVIGRMAANDIKANALLKWEDLA